MGTRMGLPGERLPGDALRFCANDNDNRPIRLTPIQISRGQDSLCTVFAL